MVEREEEGRKGEEILAMNSRGLVGVLFTLRTGREWLRKDCFRSRG